MAKKKKKSVQKKTQHEIVVRVAPQVALPAVVPTVEALTEPEKDGKKLTIPKTWLSDAQIIKMVQRTPPEHIYTRKGRGGKEFDYVTGSYVEKILNFTFGWNWDFEVPEHGIRGGHLWVLGKLTVRSADGKMEIKKTQFGRKEIAYMSGKPRTDENMVDFGNDLKAATTDALKKCASLLGIASDIYGKTNYKEETGVDPRKSNAAPPPTPPKETPADGPVRELYCHGATKSGCPLGNEITEQGLAYSMKVYGKPLCRDCAKVAKPINQNKK